MKKIGYFILAAAVLAALAAGVSAAHESWEEKEYGILLAFDDYSADTWEQAFDLFDRYGVRATFFVNAAGPTEFCAEAEKRGHEIGFHTKSHVKLTDVSKEEFYEEAIAPIETFRKQGYAMTSFAYPYGEYEDWMNVELLKYYDTVRGAWHYKGYTKDGIRGSFVESMSIDNIHYETDAQFRRAMRENLEDLVKCDEGTVVSMFSHAIEEGDWCISPRRLEILFEEAERLDIKFYTFRELQG